MSSQPQTPTRRQPSGGGSGGGGGGPGSVAVEQKGEQGEALAEMKALQTSYAAARDSGEQDKIYKQILRKVTVLDPAVDNNELLVSFCRAFLVPSLLERDERVLFCLEGVFSCISDASSLFDLFETPVKPLGSYLLQYVFNNHASFLSSLFVLISKLKIEQREKLFNSTESGVIQCTILGSAVMEGDDKKLRMVLTGIEICFPGRYDIWTDLVINVLDHQIVESKASPLKLRLVKALRKKLVNRVPERVKLIFPGQVKRPWYGLAKSGFFAHGESWAVGMQADIEKYNQSAHSKHYEIILAQILAMTAASKDPQKLSFLWQGYRQVLRCSLQSLQAKGEGRSAKEEIVMERLQEWQAQSEWVAWVPSP